jgi:hypothetical protein
MKKSYQSGFAAIEAVLVLVIVGILSFTGWFVWNAKQNADTSLENADKANSSESTKKTAAKDEVDSKTGLTTFKSASGVFAVQYPSNWVKPQNPEACGDYLSMALETGPDAKSVIKCGGDGTVSQVSVYYTTPEKAGDPSRRFTLSGYTKYQTSTVTTSDGVQGTSHSAVASGQTEGIGSLPDGTIVVTDQFTKGGWVVTADYYQYPAASNEGPVQDQRAVFDQIVKSISFED